MLLAQANANALNQTDKVIFTPEGTIPNAEALTLMEAVQIPNYWRVTCLNLTAVLLARHSADN